jgi:hypothetical protein
VRGNEKELPIFLSRLQDSPVQETHIGGEQAKEE